MTKWECLLRATGGALRADKSFWFLLDYEFKAGAWTLREDWEDLDQDMDLLLRDVEGDMVTLRRFAPKEAQETLGVFASMDGQWQEEVESLKKKAKTFADQLQTHIISKRDALYAFKHFIYETNRTSHASDIFNEERMG